MKLKYRYKKLLQSTLRGGLLFLLISMLTPSLSAQPINIKAKIDSVQIWIGEQTDMHLEVTQSPGSRVQFPMLSDTVVGNLEIVSIADMDTQRLEDDRIQVNARYTLTSFEDSLLYIPPMPFVHDGDTIWSNSLSLRVIQPFEIDSTANSLTDIKDIYKPKFDWKRLFNRILLALLLLGLAVVLFLLIRKFMGKKPIVIIPEKPVEPIPAHIITIEQLDKLKAAQLWQKGEVKEYHTELTDILREYIDSMFNISTMEMTSDEILQNTEFMRVDKSAAHNALRQILTLADLVKFAKWNPAPNDNDMSMLNAYLFVNQTKVEEVKSLDELRQEAEEK